MENGGYDRMGKEEGPKSAGVTCTVDDCDNREVGRGRKELRVDYFLVSLYFLLGVSRFGVWTAGEQIDVSF